MSIPQKDIDAALAVEKIAMAEDRENYLVKWFNGKPMSERKTEQEIRDGCILTGAYVHWVFREGAPITDARNKIMAIYYPQPEPSAKARRKKPKAKPRKRHPRGADAIIAVGEAGQGMLVQLLTKEHWKIDDIGQYDLLPELAFAVKPGLYYARLEGEGCGGSQCSGRNECAGDCFESWWEIIKPIWQTEG